ncbi:MAG TPA: HD domain-containing protein, partial [Pirellulales bacterium]|nr:HD domain-containing protein [Pirellulales bacterium]
MVQTDPQPRHATTSEILRLFREQGDSQYGGEAVSQLEHALQAAWFAERENAEPALIAAALLHDVGHLLHSLPADAPEHGVDDRHEALAAQWLARRFGPA